MELEPAESFKKQENEEEEEFERKVKEKFMNLAGYECLIIVSFPFNPRNPLISIIPPIGDVCKWEGDVLEMLLVDVSPLSCFFNMSGQCYILKLSVNTGFSAEYTEEVLHKKKEEKRHRLSTFIDQMILESIGNTYIPIL